MPTTLSDPTKLSNQDKQRIDTLTDAYRRIKEQLSRKIVGQEAVVDQLLYAVFACGHCLLEGVPGLAKTLMVSSLAETLSLDFSRIQFTPDLMPSDITGTEILAENKETGQREFRFMKGPIFASVVLADEINRTPPKTQAALMEAMEERQISSGGKKYPTPQPFFVLATQNPIEQEGTYPLPAAQMDRFMFKILVDYPDLEDEYKIVRSTTSRPNLVLEKVLSHDDLMAVQAIVRRVPISDQTAAYAIRIARATRLKEEQAEESVRDHVAWGCGPRATQGLILGGKARAILQGRYEVTPEDIFDLALPVLRHRIIPNYTADAEGVDTDTIVEAMLKTIPGGPPTEEEKASSLWQRVRGLFRK